MSKAIRCLSRLAAIGLVLALLSVPAFSQVQDPGQQPCAVLAPAAQARQQAVVAAATQLFGNMQLPDLSSQLSCLSNIFNFGPALSLFGFDPWSLIGSLACSAVNTAWQAAMQQIQGFSTFLGLPGGTIEVPGIGIVGIPAAGVSITASGAATTSGTASSLWNPFK